MVMKLSKVYGMDVYTDSGRYLGRVQDIIVDTERGEVIRLVLESLNAASKEEMKKILKEKSIMYKNVRSVEDVVVVGR